MTLDDKELEEAQKEKEKPEKEAQEAQKEREKGEKEAQEEKEKQEKENKRQRGRRGNNWSWFCEDYKTSMRKVFCQKLSGSRCFAFHCDHLWCGWGVGIFSTSNMAASPKPTWQRWSISEVGRQLEIGRR